VAEQVEMTMPLVILVGAAVVEVADTTADQLVLVALGQRDKETPVDAEVLLLIIQTHKRLLLAEVVVPVLWAAMRCLVVYFYMEVMVEREFVHQSQEVLSFMPVGGVAVCTSVT
jgi:hypothetical protein